MPSQEHSNEPRGRAPSFALDIATENSRFCETGIPRAHEIVRIIKSRFACFFVNWRSMSLRYPDGENGDAIFAPQRPKSTPAS